MKFAPFVLLFGCTDYDLKAVGEPVVEGEDTAVVEISTTAPVAITGPSTQAKRMAPVQITGLNSYDPDDPSASLQYSWLITDFPEGSVGMLDNYESPLPLFTGDILGTYVLELEVTDADGEVSFPSLMVVEVVPYEELIVEVTWDTVGLDVDLHLVAPGGTYYADSDCFFGNPTPDWGVVGDSTDNPALTVDDEGGEQQERIEFQRPEEGVYTIYVLNYNQREASSPSTNPQLTLYGEGEILAVMAGDSLPYAGMVLEAGTLDWTTLSFTENNTVSSHESLGGAPFNESH